MSTTLEPARKSAVSRFYPPRLCLLSCAGLVALSLVSGANTPSMNTPSEITPEAPVLLAPPTAASASDATPANPMDEPYRLIMEAKTAYADVQDYTCTLIKFEKIGRQTPVDNVMSMRVRTKPFSVNLKWLDPKPLAGQEAVFVVGKYDGKMRVKSAGLLAGLGFLSIDLNDKRAKETSNHSIAEAGIGNLIERYSYGWANERTWNLTQVNIAEYEYDKRRCYRVETTHPTNPENRFWFYRNVILFDIETKLPLRVECYCWPKNDGDASELIEVYSYANMKVNVGLQDDVFNK